MTVPASLVEFITLPEFCYLSGLAGLLAAFVVLVIWSQGL